MASRGMRDEAAGALPTARVIDRLSGCRVLVIGDVMLDAYLEGDAERLSPEAPVPVIGVQSERRFLGGAGNVARNIAALGGKPILVGVLGDDDQAEALESLLRREAISSAMVRLPGRPTTVKTRVMARRQQMLRLDWEDTRPIQGRELDSALRAVEQACSALRSGGEERRVVILSDYNKGLVTPEFMERLTALLRTELPDALVLVDPKPGHMPLYAQTFLITPNAKETAEGAGLPARNKEEILTAGRAILERVGPEHLLTTLGPDGMALFLSAEEVWHVPTMAREVFDVTGAGDTVIATVGLALAAGCALLPACVLANYAAGLVVAQVGAATASPDRLRDALAALQKPQLTRWV